MTTPEPPLPPLPIPFRQSENLFTDEQMREYVLADRAARSPVPESKPVDCWIRDGDKWRHLFISGAFVYLDGVQSSPWPDKPEA